MKYILKRNKKYHFKYRIPKILKFYFKQSSYFVKSLETENALIAQKNAKILLNKINYIKQSIEMSIENSKIVELVEDLTNTIFNETENDLYNVDKVEDTTFALTLEDKLKSYKKAYNEDNYELVENEAISILKSLNMKYNKNDFNIICKQLLSNHIQNLKIIFEKIEKQEYYKPKKIQKVLEKPKIVAVETEKINSISLEESYEIFIENAEIGKSMLDNYQKYFSFLIKLLGKNRDISTIKKTDFINFKSKLNKEKHNKKLLSTSTKKRYIQFTNKFFEHLYSNDLIKFIVKIEQYKPNLAEKLATKKENYTIEELEKWYKWALNETEEEDKWIVLLSIFQGFSISEITRLEKHNILNKEDVLCIEIEFSETKETKNENRIRIIPMHKKLIELGFLEFVNSRKKGFLFSINNKDFSRKMTNINRKYVTKNSKKTFHRIRASFINTLIQNKVRAEYVAALAGHSQEYKIDFDNYSDKINVKILSEALEKIDYKF